MTEMGLGTQRSFFLICGGVNDPTAARLCPVEGPVVFAHSMLQRPNLERRTRAHCQGDCVRGPLRQRLGRKAGGRTHTGHDSTENLLPRLLQHAPHPG